MSKTLTRTYSLRKPIRPIIDIEEVDDEQRRDHFGRKRVDVIDCLLDTSSDEIDDEKPLIKINNSILWLTLDEIRHIRFVITQMSQCFNKQSSLIHSGYLCFRCGKRINYFDFLPLFLRFINYNYCFICQQIICKNCFVYNFLLPSSRFLIPVRVQTLIKPSKIINDNKYEKFNKETEIICYDCLQIFNENIKISRDSTVLLRRTYSLPPISNRNSNENRYTRHRRRRC